MQGSVNFEEIVRLTDEVNLRLEYYSRIHRFRKQLKEQIKHERDTSKDTARTFDFSLAIKTAN